MFFNTVIVFAGLFVAGVNSQKCGAATADQNCQFRCQSNVTADAGGILPSATNCADTRTDCALLFDCPTTAGSFAACEANPVTPTVTPAFVPGDPATYPKVRAPGCDSAALQDVALQCARTCAICCETPQYNCDDDDTGIVNCQANRAKCTDAAWTNIMAQYCPSTCGLCTNGTCRDINAGCNSLSTLCRNIDFNAFMIANCARTCDYCNTTSTTSTTCTNLASNCAANSGLCTNSLYRTLMLQQCCATCSGTTTASTCTNSNANCANWVANGFCSSSFYTTAQKRQNCASSCGLC